MTLRLTTGFCSGMSLLSPNEGTRPTSGKVRAAVMNSIQMRLAGASVLDAFAGSGAVGIEALSRGAERATFIEAGKEALIALRSNLQEVERRAEKVKKQITVRIEKSAVAKVLPLLQDSSFDVLWFDPPYAILPQQWPLWATEIDRIAARDAMLVVESDQAGARVLEEWSRASAWVVSKQKSYGIIYVTFFERREDEHEQD